VLLKKKEKHDGNFDIIHIKDATGNKFSTRGTNVFIIGKNANAPQISLPRGKGIKLTIIQDRDRKLQKQQKA